MQAIHFEDLIFRQFEDGDAPLFAAAVRESVATVGRWMSWCHEAFSEQDALDWFQTFRSGLASGSAHEFGVFSQDTSALLGGCGLNSISQQHLYGNLGYWVRQSAQRQGVALKCVHALTRYAFDVLGLQRLEIVVAEGNIPSEGVARQSGAQFECIARNRLHLHGTSVAALVFSLIPEQSNVHDHRV